MTPIISLNNQSIPPFTNKLFVKISNCTVFLNFASGNLLSKVDFCRDICMFMNLFSVFTLGWFLSLLHVHVFAILLLKVTCRYYLSSVVVGGGDSLLSRCKVMIYFQDDNENGMNELDKCMTKRRNKGRLHIEEKEDLEEHLERIR